MASGSRRTTQESDFGPLAMPGFPGNLVHVSAGASGYCLGSVMLPQLLINAVEEKVTLDEVVVVAR